MKQEDFCGAMALTYLVENCIDLSYWYLRNKDISKVLVILFLKVNQFTYKKSVYNFYSEGCISLKPVQILFIYKHNMHT